MGRIRRHYISKGDGAAGVGLGISGATDSKSGDRRLPKTDPTVPGHRVTLANYV